MRVLLDTHLLLWAAAGSPRLSAEARGIIEDPGNAMLFSAASIWEVAIKNGLGRADFRVDPRALRAGLLAAGYVELVISGAHVVAVDGLPALHRDPFDRLLVAQALAEGVVLVSSDPMVGRYAGSVRVV